MSKPPQTLDAAALESVRRLAREGVPEPAIRAGLAIGPTVWNRLKAAEDGELVAALSAGRAEGALELIEFMQERVRARGRDATRAAEWLAANVYHIRPPKDDDATSVPRVIINLNTNRASNYEEYIHTRIIEHDN